MRHIGTIENGDRAELFTAFLLTQGVAAQADEENGVWAIWVRDEDHLDEAKAALDHFTANPEDPQYQGAVHEASAILEAESKRREQAQKNVIQMRGRWRGPGARKRPLVIAMILLCVGVFILTGMKAEPASTARRVLGFCDTIHMVQTPDWNANRTADRLIDIRSGQVWRLITPIFLHGGPMHLVFNMIMFYLFGSMIEDRRGTARFAAIVLIVALISNLAQGLAPSTWGTFSGGPFFLGMSGVVYGLLGYLWMKTTYEPESGLQVSGGTVAFLLVWMLLGFAGALDKLLGSEIANLAHGVGFVAGIAIGYWPQLLRRLTP